MKDIYMIPICGTGMGNLAVALKALGYNVSGSDLNVYPPISDLLKENGIIYKNGFSGLNIINSHIDTAIIGNAVSSNNPEVVEIINRKIKYLSFPQAIADFLIRERHSIVIAGTHGKTTTTAIVAWILSEAGINPGFLVGGIIKGKDITCSAGIGDYFVVEGDEYDTAFFDKGPKFFHYKPRSVILTGIEYDHADIYKSFDRLYDSFKQLVAKIPLDGTLVINSDNKGCIDIINEAKCKVITFGANPKCYWYARQINIKETGTYFAVKKGDTELERFFMPLFGNHNILNALASIALCDSLGIIELDVVKKHLASFPGVKRRQEVIFNKKDIVVIEDFAHHPTAIYETLKSIKERFPKRCLWAIFEPRSATSRRNIFQEQFTSSFIYADKIIIAPLYLPEKISLSERLDPERLADDIKESYKKDGFYFNTHKEIMDFLIKHINKQDIIVFMSSGGFGGIIPEFINLLESSRL